ncbi:MAG TPA: hypothetical protein VHL98_16915 [Microvirga sp.]|jgi:hypothetical protein|nr:hypothetical protein [Microvirga sp.]
MRALLGFLCLFSCTQAASAAQRLDDARTARTAEVRAVLSEISAKREAADEDPSHDLPEDLRAAVEAWTRG